MVKIPKLQVSIGIIILLIQLFLYVRADFIYGPYAELAKTVLTVYFFLLFGVLAASGMGMPLIKTEPGEARNFLIGFAVTAAIMVPLSLVLQAFMTGQVTPEGVKLAFGFGILHGLVKAFNEEIVFRGILPKLMGGTLQADVVSSIFFGFFHYGILGVGIIGSIFLAMLGFVWAQVRNRGGLMMSTGSHFAYNLAALGVLGKMIGIE